MITRTFKLCLNAGTGSAPYINVSQYDEGETWLFELYSETGERYIPSTGAIVGVKSDGHGIVNTGTVDNEGRVVITETQQMTASAGRAIFELSIDGLTHGTANFIVAVERKPTDEAVMSDSDLSLIQEAVDAAEEIETLLDGQDVPTVITPIITDWLDENITNPSNPPIDTSLTVAGAAADAKKTGDEITDLKSALNYDAEGFGESLGFYPIPPTGDGWIPCNKTVGETINLSDVRTSSSGNKHWIVPCTEGDKFTITAVGGTTTVRLFSFLDSNDTVLYITAKQTTSIDGYVFTAPANTAKALIQDNGGNTQYFNTLYNVKTRFEALESADVSFTKKIDNSITVTSSSTVSYPFTVGKSYLVTNNSDGAVSFRTRLSPSSSNVEQVTVNAGVTKDFTPTLPADGINLYTNATTISVVVKQKDTLEYRVTNNTERIEALESDGVPSYFRTMMDTKLPQIRANMNETGKNGDTFVFITDIHWGNNAKHSLGLIRYIINNTNINKILCGGDIISQGTVTNMLNDMNAVIHGLEFPFHNDLLVAFGNHDSNILSTVEDSHFDLNTCYAIMEKEAESYITMMTDYDLSFYYDSQSNKTRYIVLDTGEDSSSSGRVFTAYQEFANTLMNTPTGWNIIIMAHIVTYGRFLYIKGMMDAYNTKTTYTNAKVGTFDFTNAQGKIICAFGGHTHVDSTDTTTGGIPVIVTGTDSNRVGNDPEYPYVLGTDQEQSFDVVTINYTAKTIKCVRIGRGVDRTISYQ